MQHKLITTKIIITYKGAKNTGTKPCVKDIKILIYYKKRSVAKPRSETAFKGGILSYTTKKACCQQTNTKRLIFNDATYT